MILTTRSKPLALLIISFAFCFGASGQDSARYFNWSDTSFTINSKRNIIVLYYLHNTESNKNIVDSIVQFLKANSKIKIEIAIHTDQRASDDYNKKLTEERAKAFTEELIKAGAPQSSFVAKGYGETKPVISQVEIDKLKTKEEKEAAYQQNRRTELVIVSVN